MMKHAPPSEPSDQTPFVKKVQQSHENEGYYFSKGKGGLTHQTSNCQKKKFVLQIASVMFHFKYLTMIRLDL